MRKFDFIITPNYDNAAIKTVLRNHFGMSERLVIKLKETSGILLNGVPEFVIKTVRTNDVMTVIIPDEASENIVPNNIPLEILYEDEDILVVNKPAGMPTHPSVRHYEGTLANAVAYYYRSIPFKFRAITRLDRCTSGVVIIAKNALSAGKLSLSMQQNKFTKEYKAVCVGIPNPLSGRISAPIRRESEGIIKRCIAPDGKTAVSDYETEKILGGLSLVRLVPATGRTHQLRLHLSYIGTPIYSDFLYGHEIEGERTRLHCGKVTFPHPFSGDNITISAPLPDDMELTSILQETSL